MKKYCMAAVCVWLAAVTAMAQTKLKGKVIDAITRVPLSGATITRENRDIATTDKEGNFYIDCNGATRVTVSFVGYETFSQLIKDCEEELNVSLTQASYNLQQVEITAISGQNKTLLYQPVSITKLGKTELKRGTGLFLDDAINANVPGVTMNRRAVSSGQQFNIRGYGNGSRGARGVSSNFDGQGYKVYLNGIPVTDAEGITVMDDIDFGSIGNVEIAKGPAGTLYGLAIAGTINLETVKPEPGKTSLGQEVMVGNYGLQRYTTHFQTSGKHSSLLVNYGHQKSDGFTIHNSSRKDFVNVVGDFRPGDKQVINTYFSYSNSYDERSGELTIDQYNADDYSGNIEYIKRNAHSSVYSVRAGLGHTYNFTDKLSNTTTLFGTSFNSNASSAGGWTDKATSSFGVRSVFDTRFMLNKGITLSGITGVESQRTNGQTVGYTMTKDPRDTSTVWKYGNPYYWIIGASNSNLYAASTTTSLFTQWTLALPKDFSITAGIGLSNMKIALDDRFYVAGKPSHYDTSYKDMFSPHLAVNKVFGKQISVYAAFSRGYKSPVSSYFYIPYAAAGAQETGIVNDKLKPEQGDQWEIGTKGSLWQGKLIYQLALFDAIFSRKMTTIAVPYNATTTLYSYVVNGGKQDNRGAELLAKYVVYESEKSFIKSIVPFANLAFSDFKYKDYKFHTIAGGKDSVTDYSGHDVAGVAKWIANIGTDITTKPGVYASINYMYKDRMPITSDGLNYAGSYSLVNAKIGFTRNVFAHIDLDIYFGAGNITGEKYPMMIFVNQLPDAYVAAPRNTTFFSGFNLKYNF